MPFSVEEIARDKALRDVLPRLLFDWHDWPFAPARKRRFKRRGKRWKRYDVRERHKPVTATIIIDSYLTADVPESLRRRTYKIRGPGDALVRAADMYRRVYEENARLGGEPVYPDIDKRMRKRRRKGSSLINRGFEPYIWGHDLGDLVFEGIEIKWKNEAHTEAEVTFLIGS